MLNGLRISLPVAAALVLAASISAQDKPGPPMKDPNHVTLTGCIAGGQQANTYVLTKAPDPLTAGVNATMSGAVPTINYLLIGEQDFKPHVGHKVEITGRIANDPAGGAKTEDKKKVEPPATTKDVDPKVKVTERSKIEVRRLQVESLKMVSVTCDRK
jgi:hypothetical protein